MGKSKWDRKSCEEEGYSWDDDNDVCWIFENLSVDSDGKVSGSAVSAPLEGPDTDSKETYNITVGVSDYELGDRFDSERNYIPMATIIGPDGGVKKELGTGRDTKRAEKAIDMAKTMAGSGMREYSGSTDRL